MRRNGLKLFALALAFAASLSFEASAADYPSRPIKFIAPSSPGGPHDVLARAIGPRLTAILGQPIVVDDKPGGGMILAFTALSKSPPDGYTVGSVATPFVTNPFLVAKLPYDTEKDFLPVAAIAIIPMTLMVRADSPYMTFKDFLEAARQRPESFKYGTPAVGGAPHLATEMMKQQAGIPALHIPYKGLPEARLALLRGEVDFIFDSLDALDMLRGKIRALGVANAERLPTMKDLPTLSETLPGYTFEAFVGIMVPAGTPPEIVQKLHVAINQAVSSPEVDSRIKEIGFVPITMSIPEFKNLIEQHKLKWGNAVKSLNLTPQ